MGNRVYLIDGCRSPIGRGHPDKGLYRSLRVDELAVQTVHALLERIKITPDSIDDFYLGCVGQHMEQGKNLARQIILLAGLPHTIPGLTINRLCASSFSALQMAADAIRAGSSDSMLVGGVEHMGHVPMMAALGYNPALFEDADFQWSNMGLTAELLAEKYTISREEQDAFTLLSNKRYFIAKESDFYDREVVPIKLPDSSVAEYDEEPRLSTIEKLGNLRTVFKEDGTVTAANSSGIADGAAMAFVCGETTLDDNELRPLAEIHAAVNIGVEPSMMGLGPVYAIPKLLQKVGMELKDIDLFEINEAFAVQTLVCQRELKISPEKMNVNGGAVALGHPLGMSGLRIVVTLAHALVERGARYGIASMCVGHGQGVAMLIENRSYDNGKSA